MNVEKEREFFDALEADRGDYDVLAEDSYRRILAVFARKIRTASATTCVDLGCGTGAFTRRLSALGLDLTGVGISPRSIARANVLGGGRFVVGDIINSSLSSASYDCPVMSGVLHHVSTRGERVRSLREAHRILKNGGRFFSYDPNAHSSIMWLYRHPASPFYSAAGKTEIEILLTRQQLTSELVSAGLSDVMVRGLSGIACLDIESPLAQRMLPLYNRIYEPLISWSGFERYLGTFLIATVTKGQTGPAVH